MHFTISKSDYSSHRGLVWKSSSSEGLFPSNQTVSVLLFTSLSHWIKVWKMGHWSFMSILDRHKTTHPPENEKTWSIFRHVRTLRQAFVLPPPLSIDRGILHAWRMAFFHVVDAWRKACLLYQNSIVNTAETDSNCSTGASMWLPWQGQGARAARGSWSSAADIPSPELQYRLLSNYYGDSVLFSVSSEIWFPGWVGELETTHLTYVVKKKKTHLTSTSNQW